MKIIKRYKLLEKYKLITDFKETLRNLTHLIINVRPFKGSTYLLLLNDSPLNLTIDSAEIDRILLELSLGNNDPINLLTDMIYQIYKCRTEHSRSDWAELHDVLVEATNNSYSDNELEKLLVVEMPKNLRDESYMWGMSDTPWRDNVYEWAEKNLEIKKL